MITLSHLTKTFGEGPGAVHALDDVDLSVGAGEICAIVGPSGAGKTTLAHCANLLERPTSGSVVVDGHDLTALSDSALRDARRAIGTIFQASSLLGRLTAAENVALPLDFYGVEHAARDRRVADLLDRVGLSDRATYYPHELSGGQRQRVGIARALALGPSVLLADEATSGLDPDTTRSVLRLLRQLRDDLGLTILMITHEMEVVREIADAAARLADGRIVESGRVTDLVLDPRSALGRALLPGRLPGADAGDATPQVVWHVTYGATDVPPDWIERLAGELGTPVNLLGASVETVGGTRAGRVTVGLAPAVTPAVAGTLARWGLHGEPATATHETVTLA